MLAVEQSNFPLGNFSQKKQTLLNSKKITDFMDSKAALSPSFSVFNTPQTQTIATKRSSHSPEFDAENHLIQSLFGGTNDGNQTKILHFSHAVKVLFLEHTAQNDLITAAYKEHVGQLIFLAEKDLPHTASLLDPIDISNSIKRIQTAYDHEVKQILNSIENHQKNHERTLLQNPKKAASIRKPLAIASMLMTSSGMLNLGLIESIKKIFFSSSEELLRHEKNMLESLNVIKSCQGIQNQLKAISKPEDSRFISNDLIRITLGLPPTAVPSDLQAKTVALAALISDVRQGEIGSCFANCVSILMMRVLKEKVVCDFNSILKFGKLTRLSATDQEDFIPVIHVKDSNSRRMLSIDKNGKLESVNGYLWESPGIIAACKQLEIEKNSIENLIKEIIEKKHVKQLTIENLIKDLIIKTHKNPLSLKQAADLKKLALIAFDAETYNPLICAWESCLAAMAEARKTNKVRQKILKSVIVPLASLLPKTCFICLSDQSKKVLEVFQNQINCGIQLRYQVKNKPQTGMEKEDGHSKRLGTFVLYELMPGEPSTSAKKISSPEEFRKFLLNRLSITQETIGQWEKVTESQSSAYKEVLEKIHMSLLDGTKFLYQAIREYDPENKKLALDLTNWKTSQHLPFRDATGNGNDAVFKKAIGIEENPFRSIVPKNAQDLLEAFIKFSRNRAGIGIALKSRDPYEPFMGDVTQHAFTFTPAESSVIGAIKSLESPDDWIHHHLVLPGLTISKLPLTNKQKIDLIQYVKQIILPEKLRTDFDRAIKNLIIEEATVHSFANQLANAILSISQRKDDIARRYISSNLTKAIFSILPDSARQLLSTSIVKIADTNWRDKEMRHIFFACFFDPVSNSIQLGTIDEAGTSLKVLEQEKWVSGIPWKMYKTRLAS